METAWLKTLAVLFFIELGSRRVHLAGCTTNPTSGWVTGDPLLGVGFLIFGQALFGWGQPGLFRS